ncbi:MAG: amino acid permease, partial [Chlamydiia bacterium]|nr:amino acid permease [Chlamydiia bacterium]
LIIIFGIFWLLGENPGEIHWNWKGLLPNLTSLNELVLISGVLLGLAGLEMSSVHAQNVVNPKKDYLLGIFSSALLIIIVSILGGLSIANVVPLEKIELTSAGMEAFRFFFQAFQIPWMTPLISAITAFGAVGMLSTWIAGPSRGLLAAAADGDLPPIFHKSNRHGMPVAILTTQAILVTILSTLFLFMPSVNSSYWALIALSSVLYQLMYILMFLSLLVLRYKKPAMKRPYEIPFGKVGLWLVGGFGITGSTFGLFFAFFPPAQFSVGKLFLFESFLIGGILFFCSIPLLCYRFRKHFHSKEV